MRREREKIQVEEKLYGKKVLYVTGTILALAIISFVITFLIYENKLSGDSHLAQLKSKDNIMDNISSIQEASTSYGRTIEEMQKEEEDIINSNISSENEIQQKMAVNTNNINKKEESNSKNTTNTTNKSDKNTVKVNESKILEEIKDPEFKKPVEGEIIKEFANNKLVYSNTLDVWTTHNGVDIKADKTTVVKASADGKIVSIKNDPRYGLTIIIEHVNGYKTVYANLLSTEFVVEGENVKQGDSIGTVGNTSAFEISDEPHLHFELIKDNEQQDPELFLQ